MPNSKAVDINQKMNKTLLITLMTSVGIIAILGFIVVSSPDAEEANASGGNEINLTTQPNPATIGQNTFIIDVKDTSGKPVDNAKVSFDLNMATMNMAKQQGNANSQGNGKYAVMGRISMQGPWRVSTKVTMPNGKTMNKDFTVNVL